MKKYNFAIIMTVFFTLFISAAIVFPAIDPGTWYYEKTVNLISEETALIYFPQATSDNGEGNHSLIGNPDDVNSLFENDFTNGQSGIFYLYYSGNETIDEEIIMIALKEYDDYFFLSLKWQINDGATSQNIQLESADFNSNEYGYFPQWWKIAQSGKPLISTGSDQDEYYVVYVKLGFNGQVMQNGDILSIKYALNNFDAPGSKLIFNVYGSSNNEDSFRWTNKNTNTFGINSSYSSIQQNTTSLPGWNIFGGYYPYGGILGGYGGWGLGSIYGTGFGSPYSFIGGGYGSNYGFSPGYWGSFSGYGNYSPFSNYYQGYFSWSSPFFGFSGGNYGGYFSGFGSYSPYSRYNPGSYYGNYSRFYPYF